MSAWQTYDDVENDSTSDESDSMPNVLQKTQAAIQQTNANESFSSSTVSDKSFVKTQSCVVGVNEEESAITEESGTDTNSPSAKNDGNKHATSARSPLFRPLMVFSAFC